MALELKIGTEKAVANLKNVEAGIARLQATLGRVSSGGLTSVMQQLAGFKGINPSAISSVQNMAQALATLGKSNNLGSVAQQLNALGSNNTKAAAQGVQALANALANIRVPPGLSQMAAALSTLASNARNAASSMAQLSSVRIPNIAPQVNAGAQAFNAKATAANNARTAVNSYSGGLSSATGLLNGFGIALGGVGFAQFIKGAYEAGRSLDGFKQAMKVVYGDSASTAQALKTVDKTANDLGVGLTVARKGFAQIATSMNTAGHTAEETEKVFKAFSTVFRVMNTDAGDMARGFRAVNQIFSKGQIMAEEMKLQLGEIFPAVQELAAALNQSPQGLIKAMEKGELSSREMLKLADHLQEKYGRALPEAMNTLAFAVQRTMNGWQMFLAGISEGMSAAVPALNGLADAMQSEAFISFGKQIGSLIGGVLKGFAEAIRFIAANIDYLGPIIIGLGTAMAGLATIKVVSMLAGWTAAMRLFGGTTAAAAVTVGTSVGTMGKALSYIVPAFRILAIVGGVVLTAMSALGIGFGDTGMAAAEAATKVDTVKTAVGSIDPEGIYRLKDATAETNKEMGFWQSVLVAARDGLMGIEKPAVGAATALDNMGKASTVVAEGSKTSVTEMNALVGVLPKVADNYSETTGHVKRYDGVVQGASKTTLPQHREELNRVGGDLVVVAGDYDKATNAVNRFIDAAQRASQIKIPSGGGGGGGESYDDYSTGGLTSAGSGHSSSGQSRWFHSGTPRFATGGDTTGSPTVPGGGIPAILHSNEAVIPLQGGGIPVVGGGDPFSASILATLRSINQEVPRIYEAIHAHSEMMAAAMHSLTTGVASLDARLVALHMAMGRSGSGGSSGGGSSGGGGGGGSTSPAFGAYMNSGGMDGNYNGMSNDQWREIFGPEWDTWSGGKRLDKMQEYGRKNLSGGSGGVGSGYHYGHGYIDSSGKAWARGYGPEASGGGARLGTPNARDLMRPSFRDGTPNTSRDTYGGFTATVHPDEAVIPLPDGRSVPVTFPQNLLDRLGMGDSAVARNRHRGRNTPTADERDAQLSGKAMPTQIVVQMTVNAKDAGSFKNSQHQMMQELRSRLDHSMKNIGTSPRIDDPTRRLGKNG